MRPVGGLQSKFVSESHRRKLGSFRICALCTCCGGPKGLCLPSPCCYAINCNIPNRPFGFCSFTPKTCNCLGCHLWIITYYYSKKESKLISCLLSFACLKLVCWFCFYFSHNQFVRFFKRVKKKRKMKMKKNIGLLLFPFLSIYSYCYCYYQDLIVFEYSMQCSGFVHC